jgi:Outer membrane lipoprotein-sorting protein
MLRPTAEEILKRSIEATGNAAALAKVQTLVQKGTFKINGSTKTGSVLIQHKLTNKISKTCITQILPNGHVVRQVFDGTHLWFQTGKNPLTQATPIAQTEFQMHSLLDSSLRWKEFYDKVEIGGKETVLRHTTYALRMTTKAGEIVLRYIDAKTFLPLRIDYVAKTQLGPVSTQTYISRYQKIGGIMVPFKTQTITPSGDIVLVLTDVKANVPLDDSLFAPPNKSKKPASAHQ